MSEPTPVISANEYIKQQVGVSLEAGDLTPMDKGECLKLMMGFAKLHKDAALQSAFHYGAICLNGGNTRYLEHSSEKCGSWSIHKDSILTAYPDSNIK